MPHPVPPRARHRDLRADHLGPRPRIHHRRAGRQGERDACARFWTSCGAPTAARSASSTATSRARSRRSGYASASAQEFVDPEPLDAEIEEGSCCAKLIAAEQFERFLHTKYLGQKRFSLEGCETIIPLLDQLVEGAADAGVEDITLGMAHRGRLNVLANVVGNFCRAHLHRLRGHGRIRTFPADEGDVKYHQGASGERETATGKKVRITHLAQPEPPRIRRPGRRGHGARASRTRGSWRAAARGGHRPRAARPAARRRGLRRSGHRDGDAAARRPARATARAARSTSSSTTRSALPPRPRTAARPSTRPTWRR